MCTSIEHVQKVKLTVPLDSVWIFGLASYQLHTGEILPWKEDSRSSSGPPSPTQLFRSSLSSLSWSLLSTQHHPDAMSDSLHFTWKQIHIRSSNSTSTSLMTYLHWCTDTGRAENKWNQGIRCRSLQVLLLLFCVGSMFQPHFLDVELTSGKQQRETIKSSLVLQENQMCGFLTHLDVR